MAVRPTAVRESKNMVFMFFNIYLDLFEAIEDPDTGGINDRQQRLPGH
jgi:hypothetical protein